MNYISQSIFICLLSKSRYLHDSTYYKKNTKEFQKLTSLYGDSLLNEYMAPSSVRPVDDSVGYGLFAEKKLVRDDLVGEYSGVVQRASACKPVKDKLGGYATDYAWTYPIKQGIHRLELNGRVNGNELRFVNHSFSPNCLMEHTLLDDRWVLFLIALREIQEGEQFTVDYGENYWIGGHRELVII